MLVTHIYTQFCITTCHMTSCGWLECVRGMFFPSREPNREYTLWEKKLLQEKQENMKYPPGHQSFISHRIPSLMKWSEGIKPFPFSFSQNLVDLIYTIINTHQLLATISSRQRLRTSTFRKEVERIVLSFSILFFFSRSKQRIGSEEWRKMIIWAGAW